ncbi:hypothetical protein [Sphingomonas beigongshangi]|uniref:hypothetical protein n=1 Tax=Sphingomonas beigongshangi TaxID=2782540 RepID=UPI001AED2F7B|nr:hypothetical protein [Sphingomonas beigongshangi]
MAAVGLPAFDFIFEPEGRIDYEALLQGDLLNRNDELAQIVAEAHRYYAEAADYSHFLVLTQSCDLVRRKGACKARYITICAVRPLALFVERELAKYSQPLAGFPVPVGNLQDSVLARQFLERVMNNTVDGVFFIPKGSASGVDTHLCAFLPLSIALRADHYEACLSAKVGQATEIFAAKIGSLASGLYSRIATPDLAERHGGKAAAAYRDAFFDELGVRSIAWLSTFQRNELEKAVATPRPSPLETHDAEEVLRSLPSETDALAARAVEVLVNRKLLEDDPATKRRAANFLKNDGPFRRLAQSG